MASRPKIPKKTPSAKPAKQLLLPGSPPPSLDLIWRTLKDTYAFEGEAGQGKTGIAYKIVNLNTQRRYCLKTWKPGLSSGDKAKFKDTLQKEVEILKPASHKALPIIHSFDTEGPMPYYICDFHPGMTFAEFSRKSIAFDLQSSIYVVSLLIDVLEYLHSIGRTHCDLHSKNVLISETVYRDGILIIDFGSGHRDSDTSPQTNNRGQPYFKPPEGALYGATVERIDQASAFRIADFVALGHLLAEGQNVLFNDATRLQKAAFEEFFGSLRNRQYTSWAAVKSALLNVIDPYLALNQINRLFESDRGPDPGIPIPGTSEVAVGDAPLRLINTKIFQRLRGIKQLSFCDWYFPGASHTRFEHCLGVFNNARLAINSLSKHRAFRDRYSFVDLQSALLAALYHDIGHYPFAHVLEQYAASRFSDDAEAKEVVSHSRYSIHLLKTDPEIAAAVKECWGGTAVIERATELLGKNTGVLFDLIDGPLDCDKLDYLIRDSIHCGRSFGKGIDTRIFLQHLRCPDNCDHLGIDIEGVSQVEGFMMLQDQMLASIYWHQTIRGIICMFHVALAYIVGSHKDKLIQLTAKLKQCRSEYQAFGVLEEESKKLSPERREAVSALLSMHTDGAFVDAYRPISVYRALDRAKPGDTQNVYHKLVQYAPGLTASVIPISWESVKALRVCFSRAFEEKGITAKEHEIIVDVPLGKNSNRMVRVLNDDGSWCDITKVSHLNESIFNNPAAFASPIRVFISPDLHRRAAQTLNSIRHSAEESFLRPKPVDSRKDSQPS